MNLLDRLIVCLPLIIFAAGALIIFTVTVWISERTAKSIPKKKALEEKK